MNNFYKVHITASKWTEAYIDLKNRMGNEPSPTLPIAPARGANSQARKAPVSARPRA